MLANNHYFQWAKKGQTGDHLYCETFPLLFSERFLGAMRVEDIINNAIFGLIFSLRARLMFLKKCLFV